VKRTVIGQSGGARRTRWRSARVLAFALAASTAAAQTSAPQERVVTRPDGTPIAPLAGKSEARGWWQQESPGQAEDRERRRLEAQRSADERVEQSRRAREAALQNPARQVAPATGR